MNNFTSISIKRDKVVTKAKFIESLYYTNKIDQHSLD